jgi:hypothetical protein
MQIIWYKNTHLPFLLSLLYCSSYHPLACFVSLPCAVTCICTVTISAAGREPKYSTHGAVIMFQSFRTLGELSQSGHCTLDLCRSIVRLSPCSSANPYPSVQWTYTKRTVVLSTSEDMKKARCFCAPHASSMLGLFFIFLFLILLFLPPPSSSSKLMIFQLDSLVYK